VQVYGVPSTGYWVPNLRHESHMVPGTEYWVLSTGYWVLSTRYWGPNLRHETQTSTEYRVLSTAYWATEHHRCTAPPQRADCTDDCTASPAGARGQDEAPGASRRP